MFYIAIINKTGFPDIIDKMKLWHEAVQNRAWWQKKRPAESYTILRDELQEV